MDYLSGWKAIENYLGLRRDAIIRLGFPVRKMGRLVIADKEELTRHMATIPLLKDVEPDKGRKGTAG